jgi:uncharacterized NAD-dependent epimerase/dehydratase family protein
MPSYHEPLMNAAVRVDAVAQCFAPGHEYTLGGRLRETTPDVVVLVARCNRRVERARQLPVLFDQIEELKLRSTWARREYPLARECEQEKSK